MIVFTVIGIICVAFVALNLAMTKWDHHKLRQQGRTAPLEEYLPLPPRQLTPYVPKSWQFSGSDLNDPREDRPRDTSPE